MRNWSSSARALLSSGRLGIVLLDRHILWTSHYRWDWCGYGRGSLDLSPDRLGGLLWLVVVLLAAPLFHVLHLSVSTGLLITVTIISMRDRLWCRPLFFLSSLDQDTSAHLTWVGRRWEIAHLPRLIVNSLDHDEVVPVNLGVRHSLPLKSLLLLPPCSLLVLKPGHPVGNLLQDMGSVVRLEVELVLQVLGRDQHLGVLLQQLGEVLEQTVLRSEEVKLEVPLLPVHQVGQELPTISCHKLGGELHHIEVKSRDGRWVSNELVLRRCLLQHNLLCVRLGHRLQQLRLFDCCQVG